MHILNINEKPLFEIPAVTVAAGGKGVEETAIPILSGCVEQLPDELDALLLTADLQAYDSLDKPAFARRLLGFLVAEEMAAMAECQLIPNAQRIGVILAGDFYAVPALNKRGGQGNVEQIWRDFAQHFRWVVGVAGNHDHFNGQCQFGNVFRHQSNIYPLDGEVVNLDDLTIAGISGILGKPEKPWRHSLKQWKTMSQKVLAKVPNLLVLHEGPDIPDSRLVGQSQIRQTLHQVKTQLLVICGHAHWKEPLASFSDNIQVVNVDSRVLLLTRAPVQTLDD
jgi:3',5'-cyclic-AMP phosphodiesterase